MIKIGEKPSTMHTIRHTVLLIYSLPFFFLIILPACQTMQPQSAGSSELKKLAAEIEETNQKLEEIYHRVSVVQFMVDNHERTISELEKGKTKPDTENVLKSDSVSSTRDIQTETGIDELNVRDDDDELELVEEDIEDEEIAKEIEEYTVEKGVPSSESETSYETQKEEIAAQYRTPEMIYNQGFSALKASNYNRAVLMFNSIAEKFPAHNLADNAYYWIGEVHYTKKEFPEAIRIFKILVKKYSEGGKVADALLKIGYSYYNMKDKENAIRYLKMVVVDYPFSVSGSKAEAMLKKIE